jgi:uncharacterized protein YgiM (DUF1202 family)
MDIKPETRARVIADYEAPYPHPIVVKGGDEVGINRDKTTDMAGWVWCTNQAGWGGWVPEAYLDERGEKGTMRCDYDAIELTVRVGERLTVHKAESGFLWVTNQAGQDGWVPASHVELDAGHSG